MAGYEDIKNTINAEIITNGAQEITALVLNPILIGMLEALEECQGDLADLATAEQGNLVAAINEIYSLVLEISNNVAADFLGVFVSYDDLIAAYPTGVDGQFAIVLENGSDQEGIFEYQWNPDTMQWDEVVGTSPGEILMLVIGSDFEGLASLKFDFDTQDFTVEGTENGGISIALGSKHQPAQQSPTPTTLLLDRLAGRYYSQIVPDAQDLFEFDQEVLGGKCTVLITTSLGTGFPAINGANDIGGMNDKYEPNSRYFMHVKCLYVDAYTPANNVVVYWFQKAERAYWLPIQRSLGPDGTQGVDIEVATVARFVMPFDYRLSEVPRFFMDSENPPTGSEATFDFEVGGISILTDGADVDAGEDQSEGGANPGTFAGSVNSVFIPKGSKCEVSITKVGSTNPGRGPELLLNGWVVEDLIDPSSVIGNSV